MKDKKIDTTRSRLECGICGKLIRYYGADSKREPSVYITNKGCPSCSPIGEYYWLGWSVLNPYSHLYRATIFVRFMYYYCAVNNRYRKSIVKPTEEFIKSFHKVKEGLVMRKMLIKSPVLIDHFLMLAFAIKDKGYIEDNGLALYNLILRFLSNNNKVRLTKKDIERAKELFKPYFVSHFIPRYETYYKKRLQTKEVKGMTTWDRITPSLSLYSEEDKREYKNKKRKEDIVKKVKKPIIPKILEVPKKEIIKPKRYDFLRGLDSRGVYRNIYEYEVDEYNRIKEQKGD
jgi:hypothetical protein